MTCKTCCSDKNLLGKGVIVKNMTVAPCPDCRNTELKFGFDLSPQPRAYEQSLLVSSKI